MQIPADADSFNFREKSRALCGIVKVPLDKLTHEGPPIRQPNKKKISNLAGKFRKPGGCRRLDPQHYLPALVSRQSLPDNFIEAASVVENDEPPWFYPEQPLVCLRGRHCLEAARQALAADNKWWIVELYSDDLPEQVKHVLRNPTSSKYSDGDIFRQVRLATLAGDTQRREEWLDRLQDNPKRNLLKVEAIPLFLASLDDLLSFIGLWSAVELGTFPRYSSMHCPEELTRYSRRILKSWTHIMGDKKDDQLLLDPDTVSALQGRCPRWSLEDRAQLRLRMEAGDIFSAFKSDQSRSAIFDRVCSIDHVIPSLKLLAEDSLELESAIKIIKELLPIQSDLSISQQFASLRPPQTTTLTVQTSEFDFKDPVASSALYSSWASYAQLVLFAFRHVPSMGGPTPRLEKGESVTPDVSNQKVWWYHLASLASELGYRDIVKKYPDREHAEMEEVRDCLHRIRPPKYYLMNPEMVHRVRAFFTQIIPAEEKDPVAVSPEIVSDVDHCGWDLKYRCGRPHTTSFLDGQDHLFFDHIYSTPTLEPKRYLTSFAVKRDAFHAFFNTEPDDLTPDPNAPTPREHRCRGPDKSRDMRHHSQGLQTPPQRFPWPQITDPAEESPSDYGRGPSVSSESQYAPVPSSPFDFSGGPFQLNHVDSKQTPPLMHALGQQAQEDDVALETASTLIFGRKQSDMPTFTVLSPTNERRFRKRQADPNDRPSLVAALRLRSASYFLAPDGGKRLKMIPAATIVEESKSGRLGAVVSTPLERVQEMVGLFEKREVGL